MTWTTPARVWRPIWEGPAPRSDGRVTANLLTKKLPVVAPAVPHLSQDATNKALSAWCGALLVAWAVHARFLWCLLRSSHR